MRRNIICMAVCACLSSLSACIQVDPVTEDNLDRTGAGSRMDGGASGMVRPPEDYRHDDMLLREVKQPVVHVYDQLPAEKLGQIKRHMTKKELFALLGAPHRHDTDTQNVDSDGNDYSATVYTWRFMDQRHASQPLMRELEVRLAWVDNERLYPHRPEIRGPAWVVMSWDLF